MAQSGGSRTSILEATRSRAEFSRYGRGAAGYISPFDENQPSAFLSRPGETAIVNPPADGLPDFKIAVEWDEIVATVEPTFWQKFLGKKPEVKKGVDIDLGCLYELKNGRRGGMQAFGEHHGALKEEPYIFLSGDERTGEREGPDETITVNGAHWHEINKILVYIYIYKGADNWAQVKPQVQVRVPGEEPMVVTLQARKNTMALCAVAKLENIRGGIRVTSLLEYYHGHMEMDRAFGFGLEWGEGRKDG